MSNPRLPWTSAAMLVVFLAACGGGGSSSPGAGTIPAPPAPPSSSNTASYTLQTQAASVALPPVNGYTGTIAMPMGTGTVMITSMMQPPSGIPAPSGVTPMMYVQFMASGGPVSMRQTPGFNMDMMSSSMMGSQPYYMAQYMNGTWTTVEGPAMMSGTSMMMNPATMPVSLANGQITCFVYYTGMPIGSGGMMP